MQQEFDTKKWHLMTLPEQLGNAGSDYERALRWKKLNKQELFSNATRRTLAQLDMTLTDNRLHAARRKEIARAREAICEELFSPNYNDASAKSLAKYFLVMAKLARSATHYA